MRASLPEHQSYRYRDNMPHVERSWSETQKAVRSDLSVEMVGTELENNTEILHTLVDILRRAPSRPPEPLLLPFPLVEAIFKPRQSSRIQYLSVYKTLNTPELLEQILLEPPMGDIVLSKSVNNIFRNTIDNSTTIQKRIFFAPDPDVSCDSTRYNPFLDKFSRRHYRRPAYIAD